MARRLTAFAALGLAAIAAACDDPTQSGPQVEGPAFGRSRPSPFDCVFSGNPSLSNSVNSYFTVTGDRKAAGDLVADMQAARDAGNPILARRKGFELLSMVGTVSRGDFAGDPEVGEELTKQSFNCMYDTDGDDAASFDGWPEDEHYDFQAALDADGGGTYYVRGGEDNPSTAPVIGNFADLSENNPAAGNISALGPPESAEEGEPPINDTWQEVLEQQVLFFGNPVTNGYDWKVLPRDAEFSPYLIVGLCQGVNGGGIDYAAADMVHQFSVGSLGYIDAGTLCGTAPPIASLHDRGAFGGLARLARAAAGFLSPQPLHASLAVAATTGGRVGGAKGDPFTFLNLPTVDLEVTLSDLGPKSTEKVITGRFSVTVDVTTPAGEPAGGIVVRLFATTNNGANTGIFQLTEEAIETGYTGCDPNTGLVVPPADTTKATVGPSGAETKAEWKNTLCFTKEGGTTVVAASVAEGNSAAGVQTQPAAKRISVRP